MPGQEPKHALLTRLQSTTNPRANVGAEIALVGEEKLVGYYFVAIHFLASYPTGNEGEGVFAKSFMAPCNKTLSSWGWKLIEKIYRLVKEVIVWPDTWSNPDSEFDTEPIFLFTVDGVHCPIDEPTHEEWDQNKKYYSHKTNSAALDYEVVISVYEQKCVFINGPFPAGTNDISVFRQKLKDKLLKTREQTGIPHR